MSTKKAGECFKKRLWKLKRKEEIPTEHGIARCNKTRHEPSYQGWTYKACSFLEGNGAAMSLGRGEGREERGMEGRESLSASVYESNIEST